MLKTRLLHPQIIAALARAGHGSKVLISDGNYPHWTKKGPNAEVVYLNLAAGQPTVSDVLRVLVDVIPIEAALIMDANKSGPYKMEKDPEVWAEYRQILKDTDCKGQLQKIEQMNFYEAGGTADVCLTIATGEQRMYANLLLTMGVLHSSIP